MKSTKKTMKIYAVALCLLAYCASTEAWYPGRRNASRGTAAFHAWGVALTTKGSGSSRSKGASAAARSSRGAGAPTTTTTTTSIKSERLPRGHQKLDDDDASSSTRQDDGVALMMAGDSVAIANTDTFMAADDGGCFGFF